MVPAEPRSLETRSLDLFLRLIPFRETDPRKTHSPGKRPHIEGLQDPAGRGSPRESRAERGCWWTGECVQRLRGEWGAGL